MCTMTTCFFVLPLNVGVHLCVAFIVISGMFEVITNTILLADNYPLRVTDTLQQAIILFVLFIIYYIMLIADIIMHFIMSYSAHKKNHALMFITLLYAAGKTATEVLRLCITNLFFYVNTLFLFTMTSVSFSSWNTVFGKSWKPRTTMKTAIPSKGHQCGESSYFIRAEEVSFFVGRSSNISQ